MEVCRSLSSTILKYWPVRVSICVEHKVWHSILSKWQKYWNLCIHPAWTELLKFADHSAAHLDVYYSQRTPGCPALQVVHNPTYQLFIRRHLTFSIDDILNKCILHYWKVLTTNISSTPSNVIFIFNGLKRKIMAPREILWLGRRYVVAYKQNGPLKFLSCGGNMYLRRLI